MTREEAAQSLDYEIGTLRDNLRACSDDTIRKEIWESDLEVLLMAQAALRKVDEQDKMVEEGWQIVAVKPPITGVRNNE